MEEDAIRVLFDLRGNFEEGENAGRGLCLREPSVLQGLRAQGMVQRIGGTGEHQTRRMGQEGRRRGAITAEVHLDRLEGICAIPAGAIEVFVQPLGCGRVQGRDHKARMIPGAHDFRLEHDPPRLCPGLCRRDKLVIAATAGRRRLPRGLRQSPPLLMQTTRCLQERCGLAE